MAKGTRLLLLLGASHYGREVARGVHNYCRERGQWEYHLDGEEGLESLKRAVVAIKAWRAQGIVAFLSNERVEKVVRQARLPVVNVSGSRGLDLPTVISDNFAAGQKAARYFLNNGFRHFAFFTRSSDRHISMRCDGFAAELRNAGHDCDVFIDQYHELSDWGKNYAKWDRWLKELPKPVAIMAHSDYRAQELAMSCQRLGLQVPSDVAIVGMGNQELLCHLSRLPLSSIDPNVQQIGFEAGRLMEKLIQGGEPPREPILIPPGRMIARQSSDTVAIDDRETAEAVQFIRRHACEGIDVNDVLRHVAVSRRFIELRFRRILGRTPWDEIMRVRMEHARQLLEDTDLAIEKVAARAGFHSYPYFAIRFRREMGKTPREYRGAWQAKGA